MLSCPQSLWITLWMGVFENAYLKKNITIPFGWPESNHPISLFNS